MSKTDELREALANQCYADNPEYDITPPRIARTICDTLGISRDMVKSTEYGGCEYEEGHDQDRLDEISRALAAILELADE